MNHWIIAPVVLPALVRHGAHAAREVVSFDFAWRYSPATDPRYEQCEIEENMK